MKKLGIVSRIVDSTPQTEIERVDGRPSRSYIVAEVRPADNIFARPTRVSMYIQRHSVDAKTSEVTLADYVSIDDIAALVESKQPQEWNYFEFDLKEHPFYIQSEAGDITTTVTATQRVFWDLEGRMSEAQALDSVMRAIAQRGQFVNPEDNKRFLTVGIGATTHVDKQGHVIPIGGNRKNPNQPKLDMSKTPAALVNKGVKVAKIEGSPEEA